MLSLRKVAVLRRYTFNAREMLTLAVKAAIEYKQLVPDSRVPGHLKCIGWIELVHGFLLRASFLSSNRVLSVKILPIDETFNSFPLFR